MILTITAFIAFLAVVVGVIGIGMFAKRQELYYMGAVMLMFLGLMTLQSGISQVTGTVSVATNDTTVLTDVYAVTTDVWTNALGLLFVVIGAGLGLYFYKTGKEEQQRKRDSIDVDD